MEKWIFIDESGDPVFYGHRKKLLVGTDGYQPYLIIGMIETSNRRSLHKAVVDFMKDVTTDRLYNSIPSIAATKDWYVHARGDHPEVRAKFFEMIRTLDGYKAHVVIAKKDLDVFENRHNGNADEFYFDILYRLLHGKLKDKDCCYRLHLSHRGNNSFHRFEGAVKKALKGEGTPNDLNYVLEIVPGRSMPECSIIDYLIWAVQRKLLVGESRYFDAMRDKFETIVDLYSEGTQ